MKKNICFVITTIIMFISLFNCDTEPLSEFLMATTNTTIDNNLESSSSIITIPTTSNLTSSTSSTCEKPNDTFKMITPNSACKDSLFEFTLDGTNNNYEYEIIISTNKNNWNENKKILKDKCQDTKTTAEVKLETAGTYYWKAKLINECGETCYKVSSDSFIVGLENPIDEAIHYCVGDSTAQIKFLTGKGSSVKEIKLDNIVGTVSGDTGEANMFSLSVGMHTWTVTVSQGNCSEVFTTTMQIVSGVDDPSSLSFSADVCKGKSASFSWLYKSPNYYDIYYSDNSNNDLTGTLVESANTTGSLTTPPSITTPGTYYWKIKARVGSCQSNIVISSVFTVHDYTDVSGLTPTGDACLGNTVNISWANTASHQYDVYYSTNSNADTTGTLVESDISGSTLSSPLNVPSTGTYYWKVRSKTTQCFGKVLVSSPFNINVSPVAPTALVNPSDGCTDDKFDFSWGSGTSEGSYQIQISTDNGSWTNPIAGTILTSSTAEATITTAGTYWW